MSLITVKALLKKLCNINFGKNDFLTPKNLQKVYIGQLWHIITFFLLLIIYNEWCNKIILLCRSDCNPNCVKGCDSSIKEFILLPKCPKNPFTAKEEKSDKKAYNSHLVKTSNLDISKTTKATFKYLIPFFSVSSHLQYHCISLIKLSIFAFS